MSNTWPDGIRRPMVIEQHNAWNTRHYPGTRQLCSQCSQPTGRCEEDEITDDDGQPYCDDCAELIGD